jgi:hypothetical protein
MRCTFKDFNHASQWINKPPDDSPFYDYSFKNEDIKCLLIPKDYEDKYLDLLSERPLIMINPDEYYEMVSQKPEKKLIFAVRAVYPHLGGKFGVFQDQSNNILVYYYVMGSRAEEMHKAVLLIETDNMPNNIYVEYYVTK